MVEINLTIDEIKANLNLDHDLDDELPEAHKVATLKYAKTYWQNLWGRRNEKTIPLPRQLRLVA